MILRNQARYEESAAENERALALDPSNVDAAGQLGMDYPSLGEFGKSVEYLDMTRRPGVQAPVFDPCSMMCSHALATCDR